MVPWSRPEVPSNVQTQERNVLSCQLFDVCQMQLLAIHVQISHMFYAVEISESATTTKNQQAKVTENEGSHLVLPFAAECHIYMQGRPLGGASGTLAPGADFEGAPKRQSPTGHTLIRSTVA
jgi:hypothetical protein